MTKLSPYLVTNLVITKFGDKFITKFGEHQIRHQKRWQFCHQFHHQLYHWIWWAPNSVMNLSPNLVNTKFGDKFSDKFVTLFGDHQICHRICHRICHQNSLGSYMNIFGASLICWINAGRIKVDKNSTFSDVRETKVPFSILYVTASLAPIQLSLCK